MNIFIDVVERNIENGNIKGDSEILDFIQPMYEIIEGSFSIKDVRELWFLYKVYGDKLLALGNEYHFIKKRTLDLIILSYWEMSIILSTHAYWTNGRFQVEYDEMFKHYFRCEEGEE